MKLYKEGSWAFPSIRQLFKWSFVLGSSRQGQARIDIICCFVLQHRCLIRGLSHHPPPPHFGSSNTKHRRANHPSLLPFTLDAPNSCPDSRWPDVDLPLMSLYLPNDRCLSEIRLWHVTSSRDRKIAILINSFHSLRMHKSIHSHSTFMLTLPLFKNDPVTCYSRIWESPNQLDIQQNVTVVHIINKLDVEEATSVLEAQTLKGST